MEWKIINLEDPSTFPPNFQDIIFSDGKNVYSGWVESDPSEDLSFVSATVPRAYPENITHWMPLPNPPEQKI